MCRGTDPELGHSTCRLGAELESLNLLLRPKAPWLEAHLCPLGPGQVGHILKGTEVSSQGCWAPGSLCILVRRPATVCTQRTTSRHLAQQVTQLIFLNEDLGLQLSTLTSRGHHITGLIVPQGLHLLRVARTDPVGTMPATHQTLAGHCVCVTVTVENRTAEPSPRLRSE